MCSERLIEPLLEYSRISYEEMENKWAAILTFGLEVKGDICPALEMKGILQGVVDRRSGNEGVLEIVVSRVLLNQASLTRRFVECGPAPPQQASTLIPSFSERPLGV